MRQPLSERSTSPSLPPIEFTVPADLAGLRLDQALARLLPQYSRNRLADWVRDERVRVSGATAKPKQKVWGGEHVSVVASASASSSIFSPEALALNIVYEDEHLIIVDKPAGLVVHPGSGNWNGTMLNALLHHCPALIEVPRAGIVHRLDKDTSGLLAVAKTIPAQTHLVRQLQMRSIGRGYWALVWGEINRPAEVDAPIGRHPVHRTRMAVVAAGRSARTHYRPLERFGVVTLLECQLDTGRTHQIRVHLASIGHPLCGDPVYGRRARPTQNEIGSLKRQALHAQRLELEHPASGKRLAWTAALPEDLSAMLALLRATRPR
jgi:23S rRNA pseudouridine1911/1915/1917 synthase